VARTYKLDHFTKGTGASVAPVDDAPSPEATTEPERRLNRVRVPRERRPPRRADVERTSTPLPPGHVRKKATGEIGRVKAVDPRAGTADVQWLREGRTTTVPLTAITRR
jgi:hypothetical protein